MKRAALGIRMHSGWGVLVAVSRDATSLEVLDRRRIVTIDPQIIGSSQPYHHAANLGLPESERYLANCAAISERLAFTAIGELLKELDARGCRIAGAVVLLASGRALPPLGKILASHRLIHAAEGEFFRNAASKACERLKIPVTAVRERELEQQAKTTFGKAAGGVQRRISTLGGSLGPPWTKDHKTAAIAAVMILV
jgi:hypothetical protein